MRPRPRAAILGGDEMDGAAPRSHRPCSTGEREPTNRRTRSRQTPAAPSAQLAGDVAVRKGCLRAAPLPPFRDVKGAPAPYSPEARAWLLGDARPVRRGDDAGMTTLSVRSGDAVFSFGDDLRVLTWNEAAERLTGIPAEEAIGAPCWSVLGASSPRGDLLCHAGCSNARLAREGWCVDCQAMSVRDAAGETRHVHTSTIRIEQDGRRVYLH